MENALIPVADTYVIRQSDSIAKLAEALHEAHCELGHVGKSGENKFDKYHYATLEDYVDAARPVLQKHGLLILMSMANLKHLGARKTSSGKEENAVSIVMAVRIIHRSGEWIEAYCAGEGQDRGDKATYKATTGARKYGIAAVLNLATSDDPEKDERVARDEEEDRPSLIGAFAKLGVSEAMLVEYLGHPLGDTSEFEKAGLREVYGRILKDMTSVDKVFGDALAGVRTGTAPAEPRAGVDTSPQPRGKGRK